MRAALLLAAPLVLATLAGGLGTSQVAGATLREFHIWAQDGVSFEPIEGKRMGFFAFSLDENTPGTVPGPELRVREGDRVRVVLHSIGGAQVGHTIHWHGLSVPWAMDGVPYMTQGLDTTGDSVYVYEFDAAEPGTYWYHCHVDAPVHVDFGLLGALIVEPRDPRADPPFDREATLLLHEFDATGATNGAFFNNRGPTEENLPRSPGEAPAWAQRYARDAPGVGAFIAGAVTGTPPQGPFTEPPREHYPEYSFRYHPYYDTFMINGKSFPHTAPVLVNTGETLRLRIINGGQMVHTMHLHGHHMLVTHKDGYPLPVEGRYWADTLLLGPGARYDAYVKADNPGIWDLHDHGGAWELGAYAANDHAYPGGMSTMLVYEDFAPAQLPAPQPGEAWTSGDYMVFAASYKGLRAHASH